MQFIILVGADASDYIHWRQDLRAVRVRAEGIAATCEGLAKVLQELVTETNPATPEQKK